MPREGLGRLRPSPDPDAPPAGNTADRPLHRNIGVMRFALEPGLVSRINVTDGDGGVHPGGRLAVRGVGPTVRHMPTNRPKSSSTLTPVPEPALHIRRAENPHRRILRARHGFRRRAHTALHAVRVVHRHGRGVGNTLLPAAMGRSQKDIVSEVGLRHVGFLRIRASFRRFDLRPVRERLRSRYEKRRFRLKRFPHGPGSPSPCPCRGRTADQVAGGPAGVTEPV